MRLEDRVAFACMFLPDARLHEYIQRTCAELTQRGKLAGILLTGSSLVDILRIRLVSKGSRLNGDVPNQNQKALVWKSKAY